MYTTLDGLLSKPRKLPLTDPSKTVQEDLTQFPNSNTIKKGTEVTTTVGKQSVDMVSTVVALNQKGHSLLVPDSLPNPISDTPKYNFGDIYKLVLSIDPQESITKDPKLKAANAPNLRNDVLQGGIPPTDADMQAAKKDLYDNTFLPRIYKVNDQPINKTQVDSDFAIAANKLPDQMRLDVANTKKIYVANDALTQNPTVIGASAPAPVDIWFAQLALWIQQDVAGAIAQANANSKNILDAPVKHLIKLNIPTAYALSPTPIAAPPPAPPGAPDTSDTIVLPKAFTVSPTGRVCNPMYDVVQFGLVVNVDANKVADFIAILTQNRLIDVYNMDVVSIDLADQSKLGFFYGTMPVVQLNLHCEALFMRKWTVQWMPDRIRVALGIPPVSPLPPGPG